MHIVIPHQFSQAEAQARVNKALAQAGPQLRANAQDIVEEWQGNTLNFAATVKGNRITGTLVVLDQEFVVDAKLPLVWRLFEGQIQKAVEAELAKQRPNLQ